MTSKRALVIWAHPRADSLTAAVADDVIAQLRDDGLDVDELDLHRAGFDPVLWEADEPVWDDLDRAYTPEVMDLAAQTKAADTVVFVFPVWWYSVPAIMKGYIDRVWNNGLFYGGGRRSGISAVRWIGLAGETAEGFRKRDYDTTIANQLNIGIADACGVADTAVVLLHNTVAEDVDDIDAHFAGLRAQARRAASDLAGALA